MLVLCEQRDVHRHVIVEWADDGVHSHVEQLVGLVQSLGHPGVCVAHVQGDVE